MKIIVGLGNPGPQYETTRHNVGFLAVDRLVEKWAASGPIVKYQGEIFQATHKGEKVLLIKPKTYMNLSGRCVGPIFSFYQADAHDLIVIHDDLDLPALALRLKTGGGTGGHNGLKSIDEHLGKENTKYHRIRIGIGHPSRTETMQRMSPADYVLMQLSDEELQELDSLLDNVVGAAEEILAGQIQTAMNKYHRLK